MKNKKYTLELTRKQLQVVQEALEFFSRFTAGQLNHLPPSLEAYLWGKWDTDAFVERREEWKIALDLVKKRMFDLHPNESIAIGSPKLLEEAKIAYDIYRPILERFAEERRASDPEAYWTVYDSPGLAYSEEGRVLVK